MNACCYMHVMGMCFELTLSLLLIVKQPFLSACNGCDVEGMACIQKLAL